MREFLDQSKIRFDGAFVDLMVAAFEDAWSVIATSDPTLTPNNRLQRRLDLARQILLLTENGLRDRATLAAAALDRLQAEAEEARENVRRSM